MARSSYCRIAPTFWTDPDIKRRSREEKLLLLYYFTSPHGNMVGLYYCPFAYVAQETGFTVDEVAELTARLQKFVTYDHETEEILVHRAATHQIGHSLKPTDKRIPAVERLVQDAHSPELIRKFLNLYAYWKLDVQAPPKPLRSPSEGTSTVSDAVSDADAPSKNHTSSNELDEDRRVENSLDPVNRQSVAGYFLPLIRKQLYVPDGKPPARDTEGRDVTICAQMLNRGVKPDDIEAAIEGLAILRDKGGLDWLKKGHKATMRALYETKNGTRPVFKLAQETFWKHRPRDPPAGLERIGAGL